MPARELKATWEMLVKFGEAIRENVWPGHHVQAVAMGQMMVTQMEAQYRSQYESATKREAEAVKATKNAIQAAGGKINGVDKTVA